jgi:hypothetical protein
MKEGLSEGAVNMYANLALPERVVAFKEKPLRDLPDRGAVDFKETPF